MSQQKIKIATRYYGLFLNTLHIISKTDKNLDFTTSIFRLRLLSIIGFRPIVDSCKNCGVKEKLLCFSFKESSLKCEACGKQDKSSITISETTKDAIKYIVLTDSKQLYSFDIPADAKKELEIVSKIYLTEKLEKEYKI
ncbi:MAG: DNA repair protein RecO [Oscillospiraceae bacterium]|nr:DNA repair protein RecO [Oscillospiraceae bacterium]